MGSWMAIISQSCAMGLLRRECWAMGEVFRFCCQMRIRVVLSELLLDICGGRETC